jgi:hypothetical protein
MLRGDIRWWGMLALILVLSAVGVVGCGSSNDAGASGGSGGVSDQCVSLIHEHQTALTEASSCTVGAGAACAASVDGDIAGCGIYFPVDATNTAALATLDSLKQKWQNLSCKLPGSCETGGKASTTGACTPTIQGGTNGVCTD